MRPLALAALLAALWSPVMAQDENWDIENYNEPKNVKGISESRQERGQAKAKKYDPEDFAALNETERRIVGLIVAKRLKAARKNTAWILRPFVRVKSVEIDKRVTQADLEAFKKQFPLFAKTAIVERQKTTDLPDSTKWVPKVTEVPGDDLQSLFADNEYKILEGSDDAADLAGQVDDAIEAMGKTGRIASIDIYSSASTLRCQAVENGKTISNARLSQLRAQAARDFVVARFKSKGIAVPDELIEVHAEGGNLNGTTGPSDPFKTGDPGSGPAPAFGDGPPYDEKELAEIAKYYAPFRFVRTNITVTADQGEEVPVDGGQVCKSEMIGVDVDTNHPKMPKIRVNFDLRLAKRNHRPKNRKRGSVECPRF